MYMSHLHNCDSELLMYAYILRNCYHQATWKNRRIIELCIQNVNSF